MRILHLFICVGYPMISSNDSKKAIIFSYEKWKEAGRSQKVHVLKSLKKEIAKNLGINSKIKLVFSKVMLASGSYSQEKNTLTLSEPLVIHGTQLIAPGVGVVRPNSNIYVLFTMCHELEHCAQSQRVQGKIAWRNEDDQSGITTNLRTNVERQAIPYIKGMAKATHSYELYQLQPSEYGANQRALREIGILCDRYQDYCSKTEIAEIAKAVQSIASENDPSIKMQKIYGTSDIVQDLSRCLQNLFAGKQYPVPPALMQDVRNACEASYRYIQSDQYKQMEALLKREINHELAKQECER